MHIYIYAGKKSKAGKQGIGNVGILRHIYNSVIVEMACITTQAHNIYITCLFIGLLLV